MLTELIEKYYRLPLQVRDLIPLPLESFVRTQLQRMQFMLWRQSGQPVPAPHIVKTYMLRGMAERYGLRNLVETGTYLGEMVAAQRKFFDTIVSIELDSTLAKRAQKRFSAWSNITIMQGDSGERMKQVVKELNEPTLFWLDAHYSGGITAHGKKETPIVAEVHTILSSPHQHIIVIDDARNFGVEADYPALKVFAQKVQQLRPEYAVRVKHDMILVTPAK